MSRTLLLATVLSLASVPLTVAQSPTPGPDTLDARGYLPLQVGNTWEYHHVLTRPHSPYRSADESEQRRERYRLADSLAWGDSVLYTLIYEEQSAEGDLLRRDTARVWYDAASASLRADGYAGIFEHLKCLDASFGTHSGGSFDCEPFVSSADVCRPSLFGGGCVSGKRFSSFVWGHTVVHGVGLVSRGGGCEPCSPFDDRDDWTLAYARVGGRTYGQPIVTVSREPAAGRPTETQPAVYPNPTAGGVTVEGRAGEAVTIYDALGRQHVRSRVAPSGRIRLDLHTLPAGVYAMQVGRAVATLVVR